MICVLNLNEAPVLNPKRKDPQGARLNPKKLFVYKYIHKYLYRYMNPIDLRILV